MEAYRVRRNFSWDGWVFAPKGEYGECSCGCGTERNCKGLVAAGCVCHDTSCHCDCGINEEQYGGDVWIVDDGHDRKEAILNRRFVMYDASLPSTEELLKDEEFKRLLKPYKRDGRRKVAA